MEDLALLVASLGLILAGAKLFTNGVEWLGRKLGWGDNAVGSILAALGTALPESMIPVVAILFGFGEASDAIGVGAILGAPFMLSTAGFFLIGVASLTFWFRRQPYCAPDQVAARRDLGFFLVIYSVAVGATFTPPSWHRAVALSLLAAYGLFLARTLAYEGELVFRTPDPLVFARHRALPGWLPVVGQVLVSFAFVFLGAQLFVRVISHVAQNLGLPVFAFSLLIAPVATEMPELVNSVLWMAQKKDTLALANITGAMVLQSSLLPALGIAYTPWQLTPAGLLSAGLALLSCGLAYAALMRRGVLSGWLLVVLGATLYPLFVLAVVVGGWR
ncbi:MAG: sodium:calcium antiporter [Desulfotomaculales bacterium]